jgi:hypothetical protein
MPKSCPDHQASEKPPFLCAPYYATGENARYEPPQDIDRCPLAEGGERCHVVKHSFRDRKTGPKVALRILRCKVHSRHFTVYPTGHVPHGRESIAPVDLRGEPTERLQPEDEDWEEDIDSTLEMQPGCERTHRRRIERDALLLGLAARLPCRTVEEIRGHLGVDGVDHHAASRRFHRVASLRSRGSAIRDIQQNVATGRSRVLRLLAAGFSSGIWGHPLCWDPARGFLFSVLSSASRALRAPP